MESFHSLLIRTAHEEGFPIVGAVDIDRAFSEADQLFQKHVSRYDRWIEQGHAGAMEYLVRGRDRRADPRRVFPEAKAVFSVAIPYRKRPTGETDPMKGPRYARYIPGRDYHLEVAERLERVMRKVASRCEERAEPAPKWKVCVDTSAVLERTWAALAGLGWIGKNTLLIHPQLGSYLFLAEVLIDRETGRGPSPLPSYCGNCSRCLTACPTAALSEPGLLESRRCISYLTLEKRGKFEFPDREKVKTGSWIAGCDICQEVCPFNMKPVRQELSEPEGEVLDVDATRLDDWIELLQETEEQYRARVKESSLNRIKPAQFRRNVAVALANAVLEAEKPLSREWLRRITPLVETRLAEEGDEFSRVEWIRLLEVLRLAVS